MDHVERVIVSCKTIEQLNCCENWIRRNLTVYDKLDSFAASHVELDYKALIMEMREYLAKRGNKGLE